MFRGVDVLRLLPDRPGRGGAKFGYHTFQQEPINDTRDVKNVHVWQDSWRSDKARQTGTAGAFFADSSAITPDELECLSLHGYSKFSNTDPVAGPTTEILAHYVHPSFGGHVFDHSAVLSPGNGVVCTSDASAPSIFQNIGNRCFISRGSAEGVIYDSSGATSKVYTIGVGTPQAAPTITPAGVTNTADIYLRQSSVFISNPDPESALSTAVAPGTLTLEIEADGVHWTGGSRVNIASKTTTFATSGLTVSIQNGSDIATMSPPLLIPPDNEWVGLTLTVAGFTFVMIGFGNATPSGAGLTTSQVKLDSFYNNGKLPDLPSSPGGWDPANDITGMEFTVTGVRWTMQNPLGVDKTWPGGVSGSKFAVQGQLINTGGRLTWADTPPSYAYAWYDPATGHVSNISPVYAPTATSKTDVGIRIKVDEGDISYPPSTSLTGGTRWTHILFFRTLMAGGSTLYPIGSLDPTSSDWCGLPQATGITSIPPTGSNNYWYDSARDADLLISGALRAPQFTNNKPRIIQNGVETLITPAHMAYWDGRLWVAGPQDPAALHYSCDRVQCPFGVPEESFADTNVLRIPAQDGCVRGMKLIGEQLLVTTERWAYTIAGNNESNYRLVRISTRMQGVGDYQMAEFVSDVEGGGALVVFVGTDARVYAMPLGGQAVWISKEIQPYLDAAQLHLRTQYPKVRVHCMAVDGQRLALVYIPGASGAYGKTYIYSFDTKTWGEHTLQNDNTSTNTGGGVAWATLSTVSDTSIELYAISNSDTTPPISPNPYGFVFSWFNPATTTPIPSGYVRTFPLNFDGKKTRKQLHFVRIYVNDQSFTSVNPGTGATTYGWRITVRKDSDATGYTVTPVNEYDAAYRSFPSGSVPVDSANAAELIATDAAMTPDAPLIGYYFDVQVTFPGQTTKLYQLYKVEIGWSTVSDGQTDI